jgi:predicted nucleotidyltransferase component of viral defense system
VLEDQDLTLERIREVARSLDLPSNLVEREIIFYDTLEAIGSYSPVEVVLKGGTLISRLYSEYPRFSWGIDLCADLKSKDEYDIEELNNRMGEKRLARLGVGGRELELGKFERDLEKDVFADLLSLKRDMLTWSLGAPLPTYLRKLGWTHHEISQIRKIETIPFVESVRCTVSLLGVSGKRRKIPSIIEKKLPPVRRAEVRVYPPELCIIEKLGRFSKDVEEVGLRALLCDFYDLGQLLNLELDEKLLLESYRRSYSNRQIPGPFLLQRRLRENLGIVKRNLDSFQKRREFVHCRYNWDKYFSDTKKKLEQFLELLS